MKKYFRLYLLLLLVNLLNADIKECFKVEDKTEFIGCLQSEVKKSDKVDDINFLASIYVNEKEYEKAIKLYEKSASRDNVKAMYYLGGIYNEALKDYDKALYWFEKSYEYNYKDSSAFVAEMIEKKFNKDDKAVREYLEKRIAHKDKRAYEFLGAYEYRHDNYKKAIEFYKKSVELYNSPKAMFAIGNIYDLYLKNQKESFKWYKKGAELNYPMSVHNLGDYYRENKEYKKAIEWFTKADKLGYWGSSYAIAHCYKLMGDYDKAKEQYLKMVKEGKLDAYNNIGYMYKELKSFDKSIEWYKKGINNGDRHCAVGLAILYKEKKDYDNLLKYNTIAYKMGYAGGANEIAYYYLRTVKDEKKAIEWGKKAYRLGDPMFLKFLTNIGVYHE